MRYPSLRWPGERRSREMQVLRTGVAVAGLLAAVTAGTAAAPSKPEAAAELAKAKAAGQQLIAAAARGDMKAIEGLYDPKKPASDRREFAKWIRGYGSKWKSAKIVNTKFANDRPRRIFVVTEFKGGTAITLLVTPSTGKFFDAFEGMDY
jgi:hypothetical protein